MIISTRNTKRTLSFVVFSAGLFHPSLRALIDISPKVVPRLVNLFIFESHGPRRVENDRPATFRKLRNMQSKVFVIAVHVIPHIGE